MARQRKTREEMRHPALRDDATAAAGSGRLEAAAMAQQGGLADMLSSSFPHAGSARYAAAAASLDDLALVTAAQEGSAEAFSSLVDRYHARIFGIVYRMCGAAEAEDLTQDIFLRALTALRKFQFQGESSFRTWLYRIAVNSSINELRRRKRRYQVEGPSLDEMVETNKGLMERSVPDFSRMPHEIAERRELQHLVQAVVQQLPPHHRAVIALIDLEDVEYEEAARVIGCPLGTLKSRLARARRAFAKKLKRYMDSART